MGSPNIETSSNQLDTASTSGGYQVGQASTVPLGFYGATPVSQPGSTGNTHTPCAGATTAIYVNTTFDGGVTGNNYTIGDIVLALKDLGLIAT